MGQGDGDSFVDDEVFRRTMNTFVFNSRLRRHAGSARILRAVRGILPAISNKSRQDDGEPRAGCLRFQDLVNTSP
jgi:hypothetical protein